MLTKEEYINTIINDPNMLYLFGKIIEQSFKNGAKWALNNQWNKIERDRDGFATDRCLDDIFKNENILFHLKDNTIEIANGEYEDWRGDIERKTRYDYWMTIDMPNNI